MNETIVNTYLLERLRNEEEVKWMDTIIDALGENQVRITFDIINSRIRANYSDNYSVLYSIICFARSIQCDESIKLLKELKSDFIAPYIEKHNLLSFCNIALCKLEKGEEGLLELFYSTTDYPIKYEILNCYKYFRSKFFAQLLVYALDDPYKNEKGYYPVRENAYCTLQEEPFLKLMEWFGYDIIDVIYKTIFDESIKRGRKDN